MFFGAALLDYYKASGDRETLQDLSECAYRQMELASLQFDEKGLLKPGEVFWAFIDWTEGLDKQAAMQGVYIYCAKKVLEIAQILGNKEKEIELSKEANEKTESAMDYMKYYWGGMIRHGADTFWELYNPENPAESPYGSNIVNSYCHAWSCTPTYLLREYFNEK